MSQHWNQHIENSSAPAFVGREREVARLRHSYQQTLEGSGSLVLVSGEAGIGKSTLVQRLLIDARENGALVLTGAAYDLSATPPYGPWLELLRDYESHQLSEPFTDPPPFLKDPDELARMESQEALFQECFTFLSSVAEKIPLVLILEDLHWSDQSSLDLLRFVARRIQECPILIAATYRDNEVIRGHALYELLPTLIRETGAGRLELRVFDERDVRKLIGQRYQLDNSSHERLTGYLMQRAQGHPLFTLELMRTLEFSGVLQNNQSDWTLGDLEQEIVPGLIQQIVDRRMAGFTEETQTAIQIASAIGHNVLFEDWVLVTDLDTVTSASALALESHMVDESPNGRGVAFHHALVREAIYKGMVLPLRLQVHNQIAEAYLGQPDPDPDVVAYHLHRAGDPRAAEWLIRAGEKAEAQLAYLESCERYKQAVESVQRDQGNPRQVISLLLKIATLLRFLDTELSLKYFQSAREAALEAGEHGAAAYALYRIGFNRANLDGASRGLEDMRSGVRAMVDAPEDVERLGRWFAQSWAKGMTSVEEGLSAFAFFQAGFGRYQAAIETAEEYLGDDWRESGQGTVLEEIVQASVGREEGFVAIGVASANLGQPELARLAYGIVEKSPISHSAHGFHVQIANTYLICLHFPYRTLELNERVAYAERIEVRLKALSGVMNTSNVTWGYEHYLLNTGRWADLVDLIRSKDPPRIFGFWSVSMAARARLALCKGDYDDAADILDSLLPEGPETPPDDSIHFIPGHAHRTAVELAIETGDLSLARDWMEAHDRWLGWSGAVSGRAEGLLVHGKIHLAEDNIDMARHYANQAMIQAGDPRQPMALIASHRFLGELDTCTGDLTAAERHLQQSLDLAEAGALPFEHALTMLALAKLRFAGGDAGEARKLASRVRRICTDLGARPTLEHAKSLLVATQQTRLPESAFGLSNREMEVLHCLSLGMPDKDIAEELFISPRTVMNHVASILRKLDVDSRTAAAAMAVREQLV
jgi:DNA-binding CsgD family transcriptional regulator